jgi:hypothetical protein
MAGPAGNLDEAGAGVHVLPVKRQMGMKVLFRLQVTARSPLGALALNCGGVVVDHGWLRLLGGGHGALADLASANRLDDPDQASAPSERLTVAYDVLGGEFAVDGGGLGVARGKSAISLPTP